MHLTNKKWLRRLLLSGIYALGIAGIVASGGGGGGGSDSVSFPTPTLPAGAVTLDAMNATDIAEEAVEFISIFSLLTDFDFKTEAPPTVTDVIKQAIDQVNKWNGSSSPVATGATEDLSGLFCPNGGKAIANYSESGNSIEGRIDYTDCDIGFGILIDGRLSFRASDDSGTQAYSFRVGGTLTLSNGIDPDITFVLDLDTSGNDGTGAFSTTVTYSVEGIPGGGYLVTTTMPVEGNYNNFGDIFSSGELIVEGADNTRLRITVVPGDMADVDLDVGSGFVYHSTIDLFILLI